jgi:hypothetical protein
MKSKTPANQVLIGLRREIEKENESKALSDRGPRGLIFADLCAVTEANTTSTYADDISNVVSIHAPRVSVFEIVARLDRDRVTLRYLETRGYFFPLGYWGPNPTGRWGRVPDA